MLIYYVFPVGGGVLYRGFRGGFFVWGVLEGGFSFITDVCFFPGGCGKIFLFGGFWRGVLLGGFGEGGGLAGGIVGRFWPWSFGRRVFVRGVFGGRVLPGGVLNSGVFCPGGYCLGGVCPITYNYAKRHSRMLQNCTIKKNVFPPPNL